MKKRTLVLAAILALNTMGSSLAMAQGEELTARQQQLMKIVEEKGAKQAVREMSDEELLSAKEDLRRIVQVLQADFAVAEAQDGEKLGYKIRTGGLIGLGAAGAILALGIISDSVGAARNLSPAAGGGSGIMVGLLLGALVGSSSVMVMAGGQMIVWLTPSEAAAVEDKIESMARALNALEKRIK